MSDFIKLINNVTKSFILYLSIHLFSIFTRIRLLNNFDTETLKIVGLIALLFGILIGIGLLGLSKLNRVNAKLWAYLLFVLVWLFVLSNSWRYLLNLSTQIEMDFNPLIYLNNDAVLYLMYIPVDHFGLLVLNIGLLVTAKDMFKNLTSSSQSE